MHQFQHPKSHNNPLTKELLLEKCKGEASLVNVKSVNLWGADLTDVSIVSRELPNVEILSLSMNKISTLRDFVGCARLTELYLRKNLITDLTEIKYLQ